MNSTENKTPSAKPGGQSGLAAPTGYAPMEVHTYVRKYNVEYVLIEDWQRFASTQHLEAAREIGAMLQARGKTVRISEVHEGWRALEIVKPKGA